MTAAVEAAQLAAEAEQHEALAAAAEAAMMTGSVTPDLAEIDSAREKGRVARFMSRAKAAQAVRDAESARQAGLAELRKDVEAFAGSVDSGPAVLALGRIGDAIAELYGEIEKHNAGVTELMRRANGLGVRAPAPGGARPDDGGVSLHGDGLAAAGVVVGKYGPHVGADAVAAVLDGRAAGLPAVVRPAGTSTRPLYLFFSPRGGSTIPWSRPLSASLTDQLAKRELVRLDSNAIDDYMAGSLNVEAAVARATEGK